MNNNSSNERNNDDHCKKGSSGTKNNDKDKSILRSPLLQKAIDKNLLLLITCYIYNVNGNNDSNKDELINNKNKNKNNEVLNMKVPLAYEDKEILINELNNQKSYFCYNIHESDAFLYTIPKKNIQNNYSNCDSNNNRYEHKNGSNINDDNINDNTVVGINTEFACTCLFSPETEKINVEKTGNNSDKNMKVMDKKNRSNNDNNDVNDYGNSHIKSTDIESYLEVLLLPKRHENRNMDIVQTFDTEVQLAIKEYLGTLYIYILYTHTCIYEPICI
jgi:hypothetical protein